MRLNAASLFVAAAMLAGCSAAQKAENGSAEAPVTAEFPAADDVIEAEAGLAAGEATAEAGEGAMAEGAEPAEGGWSGEAGASAEDDGSSAKGAIPSPGEPIKATGGPQPFCAPIRDYASEAQCERITRQSASLEAGVGAFAPPATMVRGARTRVSFAIGNAEDQAETVEAAGGNAASAKVAPVRIGRYMRATLSGANFTIEPVGDVNRDLGSTDSELWQWDVTPTVEGNQTLQVVVETFAGPPARGRPSTRLAIYRSRPFAVTVNVNSRDGRIDGIRDLEEESGLWKALVEGWTGVLLAISAMILVAGGIWWRIKHFGKTDTTPGAGKPPEQ